jgi:hypothetical protein
MEVPFVNMQPNRHAHTPPPASARIQPLPSMSVESSSGTSEICIVKMVESDHKRVHSDPAHPPRSRRSSFSRLRRTISAPGNQQPPVVHGKWPGAKEKGSKKTLHQPIRPLHPATSSLKVPPPTRSASTDFKTSTRNFIRSSLSAASHDGRGVALPPPPPPPPPHVPRPLSTLEEETFEIEPLPEIALLPAIQLNDCKPWIPKAIESPTRANAVAPPPLKLRVPIKEGAAAPPPPPPSLSLNTPHKEQRSSETPLPNPPAPPKPSPCTHTKKSVRFVPTCPEIITPESTKALNRERGQAKRGKSGLRQSSLQKNHPSWSAVFLLSAPVSANNANNRPSSSPGPRPALQNTGPKSILRRRISAQNMRHDADDEDSDVEIKPLEDHVHLIISAAMEKNLARLPRSKTSAHFRKNNPLPALPAFAETPPTPTRDLSRTHNDDREQRVLISFPQRPPSPPEPLNVRKFRHPVVINHPPSPPSSSSSSSRDGSPASSRSSSSDREGGVFRTFTMNEPLRYGGGRKAGMKEERVGRVRPERVSWRAVA